MSRPAHIAALDAALEVHMARLPVAEAEQADVITHYAEAIAEIEAKHAEALAATEAAKKARADAYYGAKDIERAIRDLGFVVLGPNGRGTVGKDASRLDGHSGTFRDPTPAPTSHPDPSGASNA